MQIIIHRGTHQIGGIATEIKTESSRILIDMGNELSQEDNYVPQQLSIPGITDSEGICDAVFITHYHGDHVGQIVNIQEDIPIYMGCLAKDIMLATVGNSCRKTLGKVFRIVQKYKDYNIWGKSAGRFEGKRLFNGCS